MSFADAGYSAGDWMMGGLKNDGRMISDCVLNLGDVVNKIYRRE